MRMRSETYVGGKVMSLTAGLMQGSGRILNDRHAAQRGSETHGDGASTRWGKRKEVKRRES